MPARWFRISFSRNAFLRVLAERGLSLDSLSPAQAREAMAEFSTAHKPQHAELDELTVSDRKRGEKRVLTIVRRMQRHDHPESTLTLRLEYRGAVVISRELTQS